MPTIGIVGNKTDLHVTSVVHELEKRSCEAKVIDFHNFPHFNLLTLDKEPVYDDIHYPHAFALRDIDLLFIRNFCSLPSPASAGDGEGV
ncbi:MAG: hypothetical protein GF344_09130, partial [Chitinivibrionales bacterium]|nr:hypothetical protein [Chitinivibrionales bacterium]